MTSWSPRERMNVRSSTMEDLITLMTWFNSEESCRNWAGPNFDYPFTQDSFLRDLRWEEVDCYSGVDSDGDFSAFGQIYERAGRTHLARLAVAPEHRGLGLGHRLLAALMSEGRTTFGDRDFSLFVYPDNSAAIACYTKAGFRDAEPPDGDGLPGCRYLVHDACDRRRGTA